MYLLIVGEINHAAHQFEIIDCQALKEKPLLAGDEVWEIDNRFLTHRLKTLIIIKYMAYTGKIKDIILKRGLSNRQNIGYNTAVYDLHELIDKFN